MKITVNLHPSYDIVIARGVLARVGEELDLNRKVLIVTDDGVPARYAATVAGACASAVTVTVAQGEASKSVAVWESLLETLLKEGFTRADAVVAVGGGVVGDLAGFAAASYMRGIDFYNIPSTLLSQIDSSVGGKTAVNLDGIKNIVGAFYQPKKVLIDPDLLASLDTRQLAAGMAEGIKMAVCSDKALFEALESAPAYAHLEDIIARCVRIKADVVARDEKEAGLRRVLNFGHTIAHAIEAQGGLYHGECVALGMLPMCSEAVRARLVKVLEKYGLPTAFTGSKAALADAARHDKKFEGAVLHTVFADSIGSFTFRTISTRDLETIIEEQL